MTVKDWDKYIKYKDKEVKIGIVENLYYTSSRKYEKAYKEGLLSTAATGISPEAYIRPNIGFCFRFPFPDEDKLPFGEIGNFPRDRGVPVTIAPEGKDHHINIRLKNITGSDSRLEIIQQKLVNSMNDGKLCLSLVVRNPESGLSFRIEDDSDIRKIMQDIRRNHVLNATNVQKRSFYREIALRIEDGFRFGISSRNTRQRSAGKSGKKKRGRRFR